jgi:hypothetical protein
MDIKQDQAIKRLLKKLSALRATLNNDERSLLDGLVTSSADEVAAHSMMVTPISPAARPAKTPIFHEVAAHTMKVDAASPAARPAKTPAADEVAAHMMEDRATLERVTPRIVFDPIKEEYRNIP